MSVNKEHIMSVKEFLSQARFLDLMITSKLEQMQILRDLATNTTSVLSGMPHNPNKGNSKMANAIDKLVDLERELNQDIDALVDLKREIAQRIKAVPNMEQQILLAKRYLCFQRWECIATEMGYSLPHIFRIHDAALQEIKL